jgi:hypothetical protein
MDTDPVTLKIRSEDRTLWDGVSKEVLRLNQTWQTRLGKDPRKRALCLWRLRRERVSGWGHEVSCFSSPSRGRDSTVVKSRVTAEWSLTTFLPSILSTCLHLCIIKIHIKIQIDVSARFLYLKTSGRFPHGISGQELSTHILEPHSWPVWIPALVLSLSCCAGDLNLSFWINKMGIITVSIS